MEPEEIEKKADKIELALYSKVFPALVRALAAEAALHSIHLSESEDFARSFLCNNNHIFNECGGGLI